MIKSLISKIKRMRLLPQYNRSHQRRKGLVYVAQFAAALTTIAVQLHHW
ncbi:hypothetical protein [Kitasatospora sp. GAS1066B]